MTKRLLIIALLFSISFTTFANKEYRSTLKKMFEVSGSEESFQTVIRQMFVMFKQQYSNVDAGVWEELEKEFSKTSIDDLTEMMVPVYSKYMTLSDLQEIIAFYETPIGKKLAQSTPFITQESMQVGQIWGMKIGQDFEKRMKEKGY